MSGTKQTTCESVRGLAGMSSQTPIWLAALRRRARRVDASRPACRACAASSPETSARSRGRRLPRPRRRRGAGPAGPSRVRRRSRRRSPGRRRRRRSGAAWPPSPAAAAGADRRGGGSRMPVPSSASKKPPVSSTPTGFEPEGGQVILAGGDVVDAENERIGSDDVHGASSLNSLWRWRCGRRASRRPNRRYRRRRWRNCRSSNAARRLRAR